MNNSYKTITEVAQGEYKDKGSKFISIAYPITSSDEVKEIMQTLKKEYYDARHHCYAWRLGWQGEHTRAVDDSEPSGTAGKPILGQLVSHDVTNILVVVIRYFGGTKLGTSGLIRAYKEATIDALDNANIETMDIEAHYKLEFGYLEMNSVMKIIKDLPVKIKNQEFDNSCTILFSIRIDYEDIVSAKFEDKIGISLTFLEHK